MRFGSLFLILSFFTSAAITANGSVPDTIRLDDVTVSVMPFRQKFDEATASILSVNVEQTNLKQLINPSEVINLVPGAFMAPGTYSTNRLIIRGI